MLSNVLKLSGQEGSPDSKRQRLEIKEEPCDVEEYEIHSSSESELGPNTGNTEQREYRQTSSAFSDIDQGLSSDGTATSPVALGELDPASMLMYKNIQSTNQVPVNMAGAPNPCLGYPGQQSCSTVNPGGRITSGGTTGSDFLKVRAGDLSSLECSFRY